MAPSATPSHPQSPSSPSSRPRILVPEKVSPDGLALLRDLYEVDVPDSPLSPAELLSLIPAYHALIVRSETKVTAAVLRAGRKLKVVARAGVGVDNIDVAAATAQGVVVVNSPAGNVVAAAEHTVALLLATARNVGRADGGFKKAAAATAGEGEGKGGWDRAALVGVEVGRKTLGIVGLGKVGLKVARMAIGLGMSVLAVDPYASADIAREAGVALVAGGLGELLPRVDFLTIHTPLLASTLDLLGDKELRLMKRTARVLNVARGGVYNEEALLRALDEGRIAGAGIDVFTTEPPAPGSSAARLAAHPRVVATPHLGASTVEAQENVSLDVCAQVREVLRGGLPTAAVNAPLIMPEEYRKLQPFVRLVERMGSLYTQHFAGGKAGMVGGRRFELAYQGELAGVGNTRPLFAALVKGLVSSISDSGGRDVNIVNAGLIAKEKGIVISETHVREPEGGMVYASLVTLRSHGEPSSLQQHGGQKTQVIDGYVSGRHIYISKLDRFAANFAPEGTLVVLHNYDEPGKIGSVGMVLGKHGVNIRFMSVASLDAETREELARTASETESSDAAGRDEEKNGNGNRDPANEALMILGVDGEVTKEVLEDLGQREGILNVSLVML